MHPSVLPTLNRGDEISADHYEGVTAGARNGMAYPSHGNSDYNGSISRTPPNYGPRIQVKARIDLPRYSIFTLYGKINDTVPKTGPSSDGASTIFYAEPVNINPSASLAANYYSIGYATNQEAAIAATTIGYATIVQPWVPTTVVSDSAGTPPIRGQLCGIAPGALKIVDGNYRDLFCMSLNSSLNLCQILFQPYCRILGQIYSYADVAAPSNGWTAPTTGLFQPYIKDTTSSANPIKYVASPIGLVTVTNRDTSLSIPKNTYAHFVFMDGEWHIAWGAC